jgi:hypothetical protein
MPAAVKTASKTNASPANAEKTMSNTKNVTMTEADLSKTIAKAVKAGVQEALAAQPVGRATKAKTTTAEKQEKRHAKKEEGTLKSRLDIRATKAMNFFLQKNNFHKRITEDERIQATLDEGKTRIAPCNNMAIKQLLPKLKKANKDVYEALETNDEEHDEVTYLLKHVKGFEVVEKTVKGVEVSESENDDLNDFLEGIDFEDLLDETIVAYVAARNKTKSDKSKKAKPSSEEDASEAEAPVRATRGRKAKKAPDSYEETKEETPKKKGRKAKKVESEDEAEEETKDEAKSSKRSTKSKKSASEDEAEFASAAEDVPKRRRRSKKSEE